MSQAAGPRPVVVELGRKKRKQIKKLRRRLEGDEPIGQRRSAAPTLESA